MYTTSFIRGSLARGASALALTLLLFCGTGCRTNKSTDSKVIQPTTEVTTECTTTTTTSTTTSTTTTTTTTTVMTTSRIGTTEMATNQTIVVATETEPVYISEPVTEPVYIEPTYYQGEINEDDIILLAKLINHEASATYDGKVMVGSCVVNRMNLNGMSVSEVIFEPNQFTTAYSLSTYTDSDYQAAKQVLTQGSADTRIYYFDGCHPDHLNHFRDINDNYLGAW